MEQKELLNDLLSHLSQLSTGFKTYSPKHLFIQRAAGILAEYVRLYDSFPYYPISPSKVCKLILVYWATGLFSGRITKHLRDMDMYIEDFKNKPITIEP